MSNSTKEYWHRRLIEGNATKMAVFTTIAISIGGAIEIIPMFSTTSDYSWERNDDVAPYTPLEVAGRDIYVSEGCYVCHSQWVRPTRAETLRYGEWSHSSEYQWDRPFQLGSRRIGPDLHRVGGKYPDAWHYEHMRDPRSTSPGSIMPAYSWLLEGTVDPLDVKASVVALNTLGHPYTDDELVHTARSMHDQAQPIVDRLAEAGIETTPDKQIVALIAYLQRLGTDRPGNLAKAEGGAQ